MNRPTIVVTLCALLAACGGEPELKTASQAAYLKPGEGCLEDQCADGLTCVRYGLGAREEKRCVAPHAVCSLLECAEGAQCMMFTSLPPIAFCATIQPGSATAQP